MHTSTARRTDHTLEESTLPIEMFNNKCSHPVQTTCAVKLHKFVSVHAVVCSLLDSWILLLLLHSACGSFLGDRYPINDSMFKCQTPQFSKTEFTTKTQRNWLQNTHTHTHTHTHTCTHRHTLPLKPTTIQNIRAVRIRIRKRVACFERVNICMFPLVLVFSHSLRIADTNLSLLSTMILKLICPLLWDRNLWGRCSRGQERKAESLSTHRADKGSSAVRVLWSDGQNVVVASATHPWPYVQNQVLPNLYKSPQTSTDIREFKLGVWAQTSNVKRQRRPWICDVTAEFPSEWCGAKRRIASFHVWI